MTPLLPNSPGSYALLLYLPRRMSIAIGRLGCRNFKRGYYLYVGSAFGPGGIKARVQRHLAKDKKQHWHIDYFRSLAKMKAVWVDSSPIRREHQWAQALLVSAVACSPIDQFGCSDCTCPSHMFYFKICPDISILPRGNDPLAQVEIK